MIQVAMLKRRRLDDLGNPNGQVVSGEGALPLTSSCDSAPPNQAGVEDAASFDLQENSGELDVDADTGKKSLT